MTQRPSFGSLKKEKPGLAVVEASPERPTPATKPVKPARIQTSIRLEPAVWGALNDLATRKTVETRDRTTVHDLITEGVMHVLAVNGVKLPEK